MADEVKQMMTAAYVFPMNWKDSRLSWNPAECQNIMSITVPSSKLWLPDVILLDRTDGKLELFREIQLPIRITHDGLIRWDPGGTFLTMCKMKMTMFPFDKQNCYLRLATWASVNREFSFRIVGNISDAQMYYTESNTWSLDPNGISIHVELPEAGEEGENIPFLVVTITVGRKSLYYIVNIICPCLLFSLMLLTVFALPPESGERVGLGANVVVGLIVFLLLVAENIPRSGDEVPILAIYLMLLLALSCGSVVISVLLGKLAMMSRPNNNVYAGERQKSAAWLFTNSEKRRKTHRSSVSTDNCFPCPAKSLTVKRFLHKNRCRQETVNNHHGEADDGPDATTALHKQIDAQESFEETIPIRRPDEAAAKAVKFYRAAKIIDRLCLIVFLSDDKNVCTPG
ncbi:acetylcholine receptor subunit beta-like [Tubulanus polymorphus]|uniref:acetylcholine receptor subunit beta-like n=1 Tax=Tubulanus polymorphus TaxID=672921 RepID=UPI003DA55563